MFGGVIFIGLIITNIGYGLDSLNMRFVSNWPFGISLAITCDSVRNLVFLGSGGGVYILDVSDPQNPQKLSDAIRTRGTVRGLFYTPNYLYLAIHFTIGESRIEIWDISTPHAPLKISHCPVPGNANDIVVSGNYIYVASCDSGLRVIDIWDITNPQEVGNYVLPNEAIYGVTVTDRYAYLACWRAGLRIVDISKPQLPMEVGKCSFHYGYQIAIKDTYAYVVRRHDITSGVSGISVIDISDPLNPKKVGRWDVYEFMPSDIVVNEKYAYVVGGWGTLILFSFVVLDISNPLNPQLVKEITEDGLTVESMTSCNSYAYFVDQYWGLHILDISNPVNPQEINVLSNYSCSSFEELIVVDSLLYLLSQASGGIIRVIKIKDSLFPSEIGFYELDLSLFSYPINMKISNHYLYFLTSSSGLHIIDIKDPLNIQEVTTYKLDSWVSSIEITDSYAYIMGNEKFQVLDISDPLNIQEIYYDENFCRYVHNLVVVDSYAYFLGTSSSQTPDSFHILDISTPSAPKIIGTYGTLDYYFRDLIIHESYTFILSKKRGDRLSFLHVVDISNPYAPQEISCFEVDGGYLQIGGIQDTLLYIVTDWNKIRVIDISNPLSSQEVGFYQSYRPPYRGIARIAVDRNYIYTIEWGHGVQIYEFYGQPVEEKDEVIVIDKGIQVQQNPVTGNYANLRLYVSHVGNNKLRLFNLLGQKVREMELKNLSPGIHNIKFPVENLSSGIYFLHLKSRAQNDLIKLIVLNKNRH